WADPMGKNLWNGGTAILICPNVALTVAHNMRTDEAHPLSGYAMMNCPVAANCMITKAPKTYSTVSKVWKMNDGLAADAPPWRKAATDLAIVQLASPIDATKIKLAKANPMNLPRNWANNGYGWNGPDKRWGTQRVIPELVITGYATSG